MSPTYPFSLRKAFEKDRYPFRKAFKKDRDFFKKA